MFDADFNSDGYFYHKSFLNLQDVSSILSDLNKVFSQPSINGSIGYNFVSKAVKKSPNPFVDITSFSTFRLLDEISKIVSLNGYDMGNYYLSEFNSLAEQGDSEALTWHTDKFKGGDAFLVLIYLDGGGIKSGGAKYIKKTHKLDEDITEHYITKDQLTLYKENIVDLSGDAGDLVCYNLNGFHSRHPTLDERIALRFLFLEKSSDQNNFDDFIIPCHLLNKSIPKTLLIREHAPNFKLASAGNLYFKENPPQLHRKYITEILIKYLSDVVTSIVRKIKRI